MERLQVSIDQEICIGCGNCEEITPEHFFMAYDGLAYIKERRAIKNEQAPAHIGLENPVAVATELDLSVIESAESCPVAYIYVEPLAK